MILETKQVLFRVHVYSLDRRSVSAHDHLEYTLIGACLFKMSRIVALAHTHGLLAKNSCKNVNRIVKTAVKTEWSKLKGKFHSFLWLKSAQQYLRTMKVIFPIPKNPSDDFSNKCIMILT